MNWKQRAEEKKRNSQCIRFTATKRLAAVDNDVRTHDGDLEYAVKTTLGLFPSDDIPMVN